MKKKNVLVSTLGGLPKTVTEMYQALKFKGHKIAEIHLIATKGSRELAEEFRTIEAVWHDHLCPVSDISGESEAIEIANLIFRTIKNLKEREDVDRLFLDLTGGRKIMSSYLMVAAHLLCTESDCLYHVEARDQKGPLVNWKHECYKKYYYPKTPEEIILIPVPFVPLNNLFRTVGMQHTDSFGDFLKDGSEALERLIFCGLISAGVEHESEPLFVKAFDKAPQIHTTLDQIYGIVRSFYTVMRGKGQRQTTSLDILLDAMERMVDENFDLDLTIDHRARGAKVTGDKAVLLRLLRIIIDNARKHGEAENVTVETDDKDDQITLCISDNGVGMNEDERQEAFCLFKSYPITDNGKKVGLPLVKKLLQYYGGNVKIEKSDSQGTVVLLQMKKEL